MTHLHRGRSAPPDPRVATLNADRAAPQFPPAAAARAWDAVVDASGYLPQVVARSASALRASARYAFVSSISVYAGPGFGEDAPVRDAPAPLPEAWTPETYGGLKAACESVVRTAFADRALVVRPGLIAAARPHRPLHVVARARGARRARRRAGTAGALRAIHRRARPRRMGGGRARARRARDLQRDRACASAQWARCSTRAAAPPEATYASRGWTRAFLARQGVRPWSEMPLWVPESDPEASGFMDVPIARAVAADSPSGRIAQTIADTLAWSRTRSPEHAWKAGIAAERERALLGAYRAPG